MIIKIKGNVKPYFVQTLAMIFFPGEKFPENEEPSPDVPEADVEVSEYEHGARAVVTVKLGTSSATASAVKEGNGDSAKTAQLACGEAFMTSAGKLTGIKPPWGIMTGVRPAKVASELLDSGFTSEKAAEKISEDYFVSKRKAELAVTVANAERRIITPESRRECSVYIGIPFCPTRCAYCSFVSYTSPSLLKLIPDYIKALLCDIDGMASVIRELDMRVASVYIGGGTPTILDASMLDSLLSKVNEHFPGIDEFTVEAGRPDTITAEKLDVMKSHDVTRMSVNPQTLNGEVLEKIGRAHTPEMFYKAYETAKKSGIRDINVDLIAGLPYDTTVSFRKTIDGIIALDPENITVHTFSVKRSSEFKTEGRFDPSSQTAADSVEYSQNVLPESGYLPYYMYRQKNTVGNLENVGYAKEGHEGLYNIYMMEEVHSVFAAGASSVTKLVSEPDEHGNVRIERLFEPKYPYEYLGDENRSAKKLEELRSAARDFFDK